LENIDDEADELGIAFVKIQDDVLADEYNLDSLPALVYYRNQIPIVFDGDLTNEEDVLEWLISNKSTAGDDDGDDEIESVSSKALWTLVDSVDSLAVLFCKLLIIVYNYDSMLTKVCSSCANVFDTVDNSPLSQAALRDLENIDDDCNREGIQFVKTDDKKAVKDFGIDTIPSLVYFEEKIPNLYDG